ncbi:MAG: hypothetical protein ACKOBW_15565 [Planctomycetota bacterium]
MAGLRGTTRRPIELIRFSRELLLAVILPVLLLPLVSACSRPAEIRRYQVEKPPHRLLAAMVTHDKSAWFFKLSGPRVEVSELSDEFQQFLESLRFGEGAEATPQWDLPTGWTQQAGNEQRFATIQIPAEPKPLELSVTRLPVPPVASAESYQLQNINRWRQQMRLGIIMAEELASETSRATSKTGLPITWVNYVGTMSEPSAAAREMLGRRGMGGEGPMAGPPGSVPGAPGSVPGPRGAGTPGSIPGAAAGTGTAGGEPLPFTHTAPAEWQVMPAGGIRRLSFRAAASSASGITEITVTNLPAEANDLLANVNRWRGQVQLPPWSAADLQKSAQSVTMGGVEGTYVELLGDGSKPNEKAVLGVIAVHDTQAWFFKLTGPRDTALSEKARFEAFVNSVKFPGK